ncbi:hypothetical protein C5S53_17070 [Methanophagales archaeon]|nr:hypothetical protein C5S53_17070 [Methanophagales archaeon]
MIKKAALVFILCILFCISTASAFGITGASFGSVELGKVHNISVLVYSLEKDFDNHFVMEKGGEMSDLISFSPAEFDLHAGETEEVILTLIVPEDAKLGEYNGWIKAAGKKRVSGASGEGSAVGYIISLKAKTYANFVKPGAVISAIITSFSVPTTSVSRGDILKFDLVINNNGDVRTTAYPNVTVYKDGVKAEEIPGFPEELIVGEEKHVKLFWDTTDEEEGQYTALAFVNADSKVSQSKPVEITIGKSSSTLPSLDATTVIIILILTAAITHIRKKS